MAKPTEAKVTIEEVNKGGDWVLPIITKEGTTVYALQINKSKEDKANVEAILEDYAKAGVVVYRYKGKEDKEVLLVEASQKLRKARIGVKTLKMVRKLVEEKGFTLKEATDFVSSL